MRRSIVSMMILAVVVMMSSTVVVAQGDQAQSNKQTYLNAVAEYNAGNREALYNLVTDPFMMNQGDPVLVETTRDDVAGFDAALVAAMPDLQMNPVVVVAQGDWVAAQVTNTGTFTQPYSFPPISPDPFPATNEVVTWTEIDFLHFNADGLVSELWGMSDPSILLGQLGVFPSGDMGGDTGPSLDLPAGYQTLSGDELAATFSSGMDARNTALFQERLGLGLGADASSYFADNYVSWQSGVPYSINAAQQAAMDQAFWGLIATAIPDYTSATPVVVAEGDWVAVLVQVSGTFTQDVTFLDGTPLTATGNSIEFQVAWIDRFDADGKIVEEFAETDMTPLLVGLGILPPMGSE